MIFEALFLYLTLLVVALVQGAAASTIDSLVPIIDFSASNSEVARLVDAALQSVGLFIAVNHGLQLSDIESKHEIAKSLFKLDMKEKQAVSLNNNFRGYIGFGKESGVLSNFEPKEGFSYGSSENDIWRRQRRYLDSVVFRSSEPMESVISLGGDESLSIVSVSVARFDESGDDYYLTPDPDLNRRFNLLAESNVWPRRFMLGSRLELTSFYDNLIGVSQRIVSMLQHDVHSLKGKIEPGGERISLMRMFHYQPVGKMNGETGVNSGSGDANSDANANSNDKDGDKEAKPCLGSSPHTDWGLITVISQDDVGGLEFYYNNSWNAIEPIKGSLVVNGGDYLRMVSGNRYISPVHRVLCPTENHRLSFVLFYYPGFNSTLDVNIDSDISTSGDSNGGSSSNSNNNGDSNGGSNSKAPFEYNTLLNYDTSDAELFGDFIMKKWKNVFKS